MPPEDAIADLLDVERPLGDQHDRGPAGDACVGGDPPAVAAHHLDHHHPVVTLGGGVQAIDRIGGDLYRGVETERHVGAFDVVVDRLRHADDREPALGEQPAGDAQRPVAADDDQPFEAHVGERLFDQVDATVDVERATSPCAEHGAAARQHAAHRFDRERQRSAFHDAVPGVAEADDLVAEMAFALADDGAQHGVETRTIAPAGQDTNAHTLSLRADQIAATASIVGGSALRRW